MSNISDYRFVLYERLASQKLNEILSQVNSHNHGSAGGVTIDVNNAFADGSLPGAKLASGSITSTHILNGTIQSIDIAAGGVSGSNIANSAVTITNLDLSTVHLSATGYAVYAP